MTDLGDLPDEELAARARQWRSLSLQGVPHARGPAHEHEAELRRRHRLSIRDGGSGVETRMAIRSGAPQADLRLFWRFWRPKSDRSGPRSA